LPSRARIDLEYRLLSSACRKVTSVVRGGTPSIQPMMSFLRWLVWATICIGQATSFAPSTRLSLPPVQRHSPPTTLFLFDQLTDAITQVTDSLQGKQRLNEKNTKTALKQVRRALLDADVNMGVADALIASVADRVQGDQLIEGVTPDQQFIKAMYDELVDIMGGNTQDQAAAPPATLAVGTVASPAICLLAGLQGAGKTTVAGKLALYLKEREVVYPDGATTESVLGTDLPTQQRSVLLVAADVYRPAAIDQLQILGERVGVDVFSNKTCSDAVQVVSQGLEYARQQAKFDTIIVDTAGRQVIDANLMTELQQIQQLTQPSETLLVVDSMTGQEAATVTAAFDETVPLTGAILTKTDGDSRGGAAVSVRGVSGKPIKFAGTGEKVDDLEPFYPNRMASRILGMGDMASLAEKINQQISKADADALQLRMADASFDFADFLQQSEMITNMGSMANIAKMMPGMNKMIDESKFKEAEMRLKKAKAMINSMTKQERAQPELLITDSTARSRIIRITKGSGMGLDDGLQFMSEFQRMRTMMSRMQKQMGGSGGNEETSAETDMSSMAGNRAARRAAKKKKKSGRGGGGGFG